MYIQYIITCYTYLIFTLGYDKFNNTKPTYKVSKVPSVSDISDISDVYNVSAVSNLSKLFDIKSKESSSTIIPTKSSSSFPTNVNISPSLLPSIDIITKPVIFTLSNNDLYITYDVVNVDFYKNSKKQ